MTTHRVAGGVLELSSPAAPLEPGGAVRAQAVLEFFKRTRVTPTPPTARAGSPQLAVQESLQPNGSPFTPTSLGPGHGHRINLRGAVGGDTALDQSIGE